MKNQTKAKKCSKKKLIETEGSLFNGSWNNRTDLFSRGRAEILDRGKWFSLFGS